MKKGISALIATVLILGFTIVIAAIVLVWGRGFVEDITKRTEATTQTQLICANDVLVDISHVCNTSLNVFKVTLKNDGTKDIDKLMLRFYESPSVVKTFETTDGLAAFSVDTKDVTVTGIANQVKLVEAVPVITIGNDQVTCAASIVEFGNLDNERAWVKDCT